MSIPNAVLVDIETIKLNPSNPRVIEDDKFESLIESIKESPKILKIRPIVVNKDMIVLGGNQRLKACRKAGLKEVWIINADLADEQQRTFLIKDNLDYGQHDAKILKEKFSIDDIERCGIEMDIVDVDTDIETEDKIYSDDEYEPQVSQEEIEEAKKGFSGNSIKQIIFIFHKDIYEGVLKDLDEISRILDCDDNSEAFLRLINLWECSNGISS